MTSTEGRMEAALADTADLRVWDLPVRAMHWLLVIGIGVCSIVVMLGLVLAVVVLGLFAVDVDGLYSGPLSSYVTFKQGRHLAHQHYYWFNILLWAIALHLAAVLFYFIYKRQNLVGPMIHGKLRGAANAEKVMCTAPAWRFLAGVVLVSAVVWAVIRSFYF